MREHWKPCPSHTDIYEVSDLGRVRHRRTGYVQRGSPNTGGYYQVTLCGKVHRIHNLVMRAFVGPVPNGHEVNHTRGIKRDNRLIRLEYVTHSQNQEHATRVLQATKGIRNGRAILNPSKVRTIKRLVKQGMSCVAIGAKFGVHRNTIDRIKHGETWV